MAFELGPAELERRDSHGEAKSNYLSVVILNIGGESLTCPLSSISLIKR